MWVLGAFVLAEAAAAAFTPGLHKCTFTLPKSQGAAEEIYRRISPLNNKRYEIQDSYGKYSFTVGICTSVDEKNAGVIQNRIDNGKKTHLYICGRINKAQIMDGEEWVLLKYLDGYNSSKASIMIVCDETATDSNPKLKVLEENLDKELIYDYLFVLGHKCVCAKKPLITFGLSIGSIILIIFTCVAFFYLILGFLYMRFVLRAKGVEQIPNYGFWLDFGNLLSDGCDLVCRSGHRKESRTYKGIGDDQLQEDEDRDDHLLPM